MEEDGKENNNNNITVRASQSTLMPTTVQNMTARVWSTGQKDSYIPTLS